MPKIQINNVLRDMTDAEIAEMNAAEVKANEDLAKFKEQKDAKIALQNSARSKLVAGEPLTEEEAAIIVPIEL
tara:strand:+ start:680 stop:898 length:219 start_codon:yes stop_codon:yes gene_type:complete